MVNSVAHFAPWKGQFLRAYDELSGYYSYENFPQASDLYQHYKMLLQLELNVYVQAYNNDQFYDGSPGTTMKPLYVPGFLEDQFQAVSFQHMLLFLLECKLSCRNGVNYMNVPIKKVW